MRRVEIGVIIVHADLLSPQRFKHLGKRPASVGDVIAVIRDRIQNDRNHDEEQTAPYRRHQQIVEPQIDVFTLAERKAEHDCRDDRDADQNQQRHIEPLRQENLADRIDAVIRVRLHHVLPLDHRAIAIVGHVQPTPRKVQRNDAEHKQHRKIRQHVDRQFFAFLLRLTHPFAQNADDVIDEIAEVQHRKARAGIEARPFRRGAEPEHEPRKPQKRKLFPVRTALEILGVIIAHEQEHQQRKEQRIGVDRGDARLREVHAVDRKQSGGHERIVRTTEDALCEHIQNRKDQHAEERPGKAPAERRHAEDADAARDEQLAERRMRPFIDRVAVLRGALGSFGAVQIVVLHDLVGGSRMIDLVEIHIVEIRMIQRNFVLLVEQFLCAVRRRNYSRRQQRVAVENRDLVHGDRAAVHAQRQVSRIDIQRKLLPLVHVAEILREGFQRVALGAVDERKGPLIVIVVDPELAFGNAAVKAQFGHMPRFAEVDEHLCAGLRGPDRLRRGKRTEVQKRSDGIDRKQQKQQHVIELCHTAAVFGAQVFSERLKIHAAHLRPPR